MKISMFLPEVS